MADYLQSESRWARTQQAEVRAERERLEDPAQLAHAIRRAEYAVGSAEVHLRIAKADLEKLTDPTLLDTEIERLKRDEDHWAQIAGEYEKRLAERDQPSLLEGTD